jgi:hypothetical protein
LATGGALSRFAGTGRTIGDDRRPLDEGGARVRLCLPQVTGFTVGVMAVRAVPRRWRR